MSDSAELEDLDALVRSAGWARLKDYVVQEWRTRMDAKVRAAVSSPDDLLAMRHLQQVVVAKEAVEQIMGWPEERLNAIRRTQTHDVVNFSRRGSL